jgi:hypothetical protein
VLTAPMPTSSTPSFPVASAIFWGFFTTGNYIINILWGPGLAVVVRGPPKPRRTGTGRGEGGAW